jgi:hypothetical protein
MKGSAAGIALGFLLGLGATTLSAQRTDVSQTITQGLAFVGGSNAGLFVMPEFGLSDDSTDTFVRGFLATDEDGDFRAGAQWVGYFQLPRPAQIPEGDDFYGEARIMVLRGNHPGEIDTALLASTSALVDYGDWGLVGGVEVGALRRGEVQGASISLQLAAWQQLPSLLARVAYRWTRFPLRIPDPAFFQAQGRTRYHDLSVDLTPKRWGDVTLRFGHRFRVPGGTWAILEVTRPLSESLLLSLSGGRQPGSPELSTQWGEFVSVGVRWRPDFGGRINAGS